MGPGFDVHPRLRADTHEVGDLALCRVLLMDDATWPWLILVPRLPGLRDPLDLPVERRHQLSDELALAQQALRALHAPDKLNVAALGNVVEQLHVHVIARWRDDPAWPGPVWGKQAPQPYAAELVQERIGQLRMALGLGPASARSPF